MGLFHAAGIKFYAYDLQNHDDRLHTIKLLYKYGAQFTSEYLNDACKWNDSAIITFLMLDAGLIPNLNTLHRVNTRDFTLVCSRLEKKNYNLALAVLGKCISTTVVIAGTSTSSESYLVVVPNQLALRWMLQLETSITISWKWSNHSELQRAQRRGDWWENLVTTVNKIPTLCSLDVNCYTSPIILQGSLKKTVASVSSGSYLSFFCKVYFETLEIRSLQPIVETVAARTVPWSYWQIPWEKVFATACRGPSGINCLQFNPGKFQGLSNETRNGPTKPLEKALFGFLFWLPILKKKKKET